MVLAQSSICYYLHYSLTFHFIERKSIIHCTHVDGCFQASMIQGGQGVRWTTVHIVSVDATRSGSGENKRSFSNTHMHTDCILIILFPVCMSLPLFFFFLKEPCLKELTLRFKQSSESLYSHSANMQDLDVQQRNIAVFHFSLNVCLKSTVSSQNQHVIGVG